MRKLSRLAALAAALAACARALPTYGRAPSFGQDDLSGRPWIADFVYTSCPGPCPVLTANMARLQSALPPAVRLVSFTVDPQRDTPQVLAEYGRRFGADPSRWRFVRLDEPSLARMMEDGFKLAVQNDGHITHSTKFVLVDGAGAIRGYYDGEDEDSLKRLKADAASLL